MNEDIKKIKEDFQKKENFHDKVVREMKQYHSNKKPIVSPIEKETEIKVNALEYYNSLSDSEKLDFDKELQKKKVRESYITYLKYVYGDIFKITPFHTALANIAESVVRKVEKNQQVRLLLSVPPQFGKGYPVDFPILTTNGWKKHGDLKVGDYVYNDKGQAVRVLGNQKPYMHECLKITFSTCEQHIITREHLWKVLFCYETRRNNGSKRVHGRERREEIVETQEIMRRLQKCNRNPSILINKPLQNDYRDLLISPYVLGLWLGDGLKSTNEIVVSDKDMADEVIGIGNDELINVIKKKGNKNVSYLKLGSTKEILRKGDYKWDFTKRLNDLGVRNHKHIPTEYLLASEEQRWELLRGLMDTDGTISKTGSTCEYCGINEELCIGVLTLCRSLGIKATLRIGKAKLNGKVISNKYRVCFTPSKGQTIFKIARKQERVDNKLTENRIDKDEYFITKIEEVENQLVSCISVDGGMYLAGKGLIPTHNSMTITESLPSWFLMRNPDLSCILTAYNADIAEKFGDRNRQKIKDFGKDLFGLEISDSQDNKTLFQIKNHLGQCLSAGILGALTSNPSALTIIDDPFKNGLEASNVDLRNKVYEVYRDSILTRTRAMGGAIIVIHTRWHEDDLIGRLLQEDGWTYVNIPCVWESGVDKLLHRKVGEVLCPELGHTVEWAEKIKKAQGSKNWNALYQGKPFIEGGNIVQRNTLKWYNDKSKPNAFEEITMSCDLSFGGMKTDNDPSCITIWGRNGGDHYLLEVINKRMTFTQTLERIQYLCGKYPTMRKKIVEQKANGNATIEMLNQKIGGFVPFNPKSDSKETRLRLVAPYFESGNVYFPEEKLCENIEEYVNQLLKFPSVPHDDFVDTISQYLLNYSYKYNGGIVESDSVYATLSKIIRGV